MQGACTDQAEKIRNLKYEVENLLAQFTVVLAIDLAFAWVTFGTSVAAEAALAEGLAGRLNWALELFIDETAELSKATTTAIKKLSEVGAKSIVDGTVGLGKAGVGVPLSTIISGALGKKNAEDTSILENILKGGAFYAIEGAITGSASALSVTLRNLGEEGGPDSARLLLLSRRLKSGSITVEAANQAVQSMLQTGSITPANYASAVISGRLKTALEPHPGKHAGH